MPERSPPKNEESGPRSGPSQPARGVQRAVTREGTTEERSACTQRDGGQVAVSLSDYCAVATKPHRCVRVPRCWLEATQVRLVASVLARGDSGGSECGAAGSKRHRRVWLPLR